MSTRFTPVSLYADGEAPGQKLLGVLDSQTGAVVPFGPAWLPIADEASHVVTDELNTSPDERLGWTWLDAEEVHDVAALENVEAAS